MTTIENAERLVDYLRLHHREEDAVIDRVLEKLLYHENQALQKQRAELRSELDVYE